MVSILFETPLRDIAQKPPYDSQPEQLSISIEQAPNRNVSAMLSVEFVIFVQSFMSTPWLRLFAGYAALYNSATQNHPTWSILVGKSMFLGSPKHHFTQLHILA